MISKKQLYEGTQVMQARIHQLENKLSMLTTDSILNKNKINPQICNSVAYNVVLSVQDKIQATHRYDTYIEGLDLPSHKLEALFYSYGALCFFKEDTTKVTTFAKTGKLNGLGDLSEVIPIDFAGVSYSTHKFPVYNADVQSNACVIIEDYTGSYKEDMIIPRISLNSVSINDQCEVYRQLKNSIKLTAKKAIATIDSPTQASASIQSIRTMIDNDDPIVAIVGELGNAVKLFNLDTKLDIQGYLQAIETYEKIRANFNGIHTKSPIEKKQRLIVSENEDANCLTDVYLYDGLINRQIGIELMKKHNICGNNSYCKIREINSTTMEKEDDNGKSNNIIQNNSTDV